MTKLNFLFELRDKLRGLPQNEVEERLSFYSEIIEDRVEDGVSEEDAIAEIGNIDDIVAQIISDIPLTKIAKEKIKSKRRLKTWEFLFIILGFPIWFSLIVAISAAIISLYVVLWSIVISLWSIFVSFVACSFVGIFAGALFFFTKGVAVGLAVIGASLVLLGLSILMFFVCKITTKGTIILTKKIILNIKKCFIKKEEA